MQPRECFFYRPVVGPLVHHQPSPQPSSSSASFGFKSIFFDVTGLDAGLLATAGFLEGAAVVPGLARPFGSVFPALFFCACAANQPAKSGSAPSSNAVMAVAVSFVAWCGLGSSDGTSKKASSPMSPQPA